MGRSVVISVMAPSTPTISGASRRATQKDWVAPMTTTPAYAPSMYSSPCAKFITPRSPKMTVRPSASSPSAAPNTRPCRSCGSRTATRYSTRSGSVLLLDLPGEALHRVLADHRRADGVAACDLRDGQVLALLHAVEVHVHHDLVVFLADALL